MDFPINLSNNPLNMIDSQEELFSTLYHLLKNEKGDFLQSLQVGSAVSLHSTSTDDIAHAIEATILQVEGVVVTGVTMIKEDSYRVTITYKSQAYAWDVNLKSLRNEQG